MTDPATLLTTFTTRFLGIFIEAVPFLLLGSLISDLISFVYRDIRFKDKPLFMVARFTISCCVADATAIGVIINSDQAASLTSDSWFHVTDKSDV